jgi:RNA polymerase sigma-70 factor (ECF subfamily)
MSDKTLLKGQFDGIYRAESDAVFRFCLLRTSDREIALDFTQDTFMKFWNVLSDPDRKPVKNYRTFLFTIARNQVIDWYRKKKSLSLEAMMEGADGETSDAFTPALEGSVETKVEAEFLVRKIEGLAEPYRHAVYLRCVEELKPREIAQILGESVNVISVRISRGLRQLRTQLHYDVS